MPTKTPNYNLIKPSGSEFVEVSVLNGNMDIIDTQLGNLSTMTDELTLYVTKLGNDSAGNGTVSKPYKTIQYAISKVNKKTSKSIKIRVGKGDYTDEGEIVLQGLGGSQYYLQAFDGIDDVMTPSADYKVRRLLVRDCDAVYINGFDLKPESGYGIFTNNVKFAKYTGIRCVSSVGSAFGCTTNSLVWCKDCTCSYLPAVISANLGARVVSENFINSVGNTVGITANTGAIVHLYDDNQPVGEARFQQNNGSTYIKPDGTLLTDGKSVDLVYKTHELSEAGNIVVTINLSKTPKFVTVEAVRDLKTACSTGYYDVGKPFQYCKFSMEDGKQSSWPHIAAILDGGNNVVFDVVSVTKTDVTIKPTITGVMSGKVNFIVKAEC